MRPCISIRGFVRPLVGRSVGRSVVIELERVKTRISAPAHPSATGIGRVSGLVIEKKAFNTLTRMMKMHRILEISQIIASFHKVDAILHHS